MKVILTIFIITLFFVGCSTKKVLPEDSKKELALLIQDLSLKIDKVQAYKISNDAIEYSKKLAIEYEVNSPPLIHNSLINLGIKEKGYCYHYANDLMEHLKKKEYKNIKLYRAVSKRGQYFEHGSLILSSTNVKFEDSIVLDAWRYSGKLYFSKVKDDKKYDWEIK